ncbi:MAG: HepT-like ribonuclease domain-containing protein [Dehalococcoidia bacterium]
MQQDASLLLDMVLWGREAKTLVEGMSWEEFTQSRATQLGLVYALQTIGEAASKVSGATQAARADIPWRPVINMRHRLVHDCGRVDLAIVWSTVQTHVPLLIAALEPLIPPEE